MSTFALMMWRFVEHNKVVDMILPLPLFDDARFNYYSTTKPSTGNLIRSSFGGGQGMDGCVLQSISLDINKCVFFSPFYRCCLGKAGRLGLMPYWYWSVKFPGHERRNRASSPSSFYGWACAAGASHIIHYLFHDLVLRDRWDDGIWI